MVKILKKIIKYVIAPIILLIVLGMSLLFFPSIQKKIVLEIETLFNKNTDVNISFKEINISPLGFIDIQNIILKDSKNDTILFIKQTNTFVYPHSIIMKKLSFAYLSLDSGFVKIKKYDEDIKDNFQTILDKFLNKEDTISTDMNIAFKSTFLNISNFSYTDFYRNTKIDDIELFLTGININNQKKSFTLKSIKIHKEGYSDIKTNGHFLIEKDNVLIDDFVLKKGNTFIDANLEFSFKKNIDIKKVKVKAEIDYKDFEEFVFLDVNTKKENIYINLEKKKNDNINIHFTNKKDVTFNGNVFINSEDIIFNIIEFKGYYNQLENIVKVIKPIELPKFKDEKKFDIKGRIKKIEDSLNLDLIYKTEDNIGEIEIKGLSNLEFKNYTLNLKIDSLNLYRFIDNNKLGYLNSEITLKSNDDTIKSNVYLSEFVFDNTKYNNIIGNIIGYKSNLLGNINSQDDNINLNLDFKILEKEKHTEINLNVDLNKIIIPLNKENLELSMFLDGNMIYDKKNTEDLKLNIDISNIKSFYKTKKNDLGNLKIISNNSLNYKSLNIVSENIINSEIKGNFNYIDFKKVLIHRLNKFLLVNDSNNFYSKEISLFFEIKKDFLKLLEIQSSDDFILKLNNVKNNLDIGIKNIEHLYYNGYYFNNINLNFRDGYENDNLLNLKIDSLYSNLITLKDVNLLIESEINNLKSLKLLTKNNFNKESIFNIDYMKEKENFLVKIKKSILRNGENQDIYINEKNNEVKIKFNTLTKDLFIDTLRIGDYNKYLFITGGLEKGKGDIDFNLKGIKIDFTYADDTLFKVKGDLNSKFIITVDGEKIVPKGNITIDNFKLSGEDHGRVVLNITENKNIFYSDLSIIKDNIQTFRAKGDLNLKEKINLDINFNNFDIHFLSAMTQSGLTNIRGKLSGNGNFIYNSIDDLYLTGNYKLKKGGLGIGYLNIDKNLGEESYFSMNKQGFVLNSMELYEENKKIGEVSGVIQHDDFKVNSWFLDLNIDAYGGIVFNQDKINSDGIKGLLYADGLYNLKGFIMRELNHTVKAKIVNNSNFHISINEINKKKQSNIIFKKDEKQESLLIKNNVPSINKFNFDIDIDEKTNILIYLKESKGTFVKMNDRISLYGNGEIDLKSVTSDVIELQGRYDIVKGECFLSIEDIVEKKLDIIENSYIISEGDIKKSMININARYKTKLNIANYITSSNNSRYEAWLDLKISENISNPKFDFDIKLPYSSQEVQNELLYKMNEGNEKQNQFFSVLSFGSFSSNDQNYSLFSGDYLVGTLLSSQLSNIANRLTDDIDINLNYIRNRNNNLLNNSNNLQSGLNNQIEVGLSKKLFSDKISISGSLGVPISDNQSNTNNSFSTDIQVEASITDDNKWKAKIFSKQEPSIIQQGENNISQGVGISYKNEFNDFFSFMKSIIFFWKKEDENINNE